MKKLHEGWGGLKAHGGGSAGIGDGGIGCIGDGGTQVILPIKDD